MNLTAFILTFRNAEYLDLAASSIANQTRRPDRVVILGMDGLDETTREIERVAALYGFEYRISPPPLTSCPVGKMFAASLVRTDAFMLLDGDDWLEPEYVEACLGWMEDSKADVVGCDYRWAGDLEGEATLPPICEVEKANPLPACSIIRMTAYQAAFGFRNVFSEDWLLWQTLYRLGYKLERVPAVLFNYYKHPKSLCARLKGTKDFSPMENPCDP